MRGYFLLFLFSTLTLGTLFGQNIQKMNSWQDSLVDLGHQMFVRVAEAERLESNFKFIKTLVSALQEPNAYYYSFDKLDMISILSSPQDDFRIFSWNIPLQDGSFLYYGAIQHKIAGGKLHLTPLLDKTFEISNPDEDVTTNQMWYGAQYYGIVPVADGKYALLGWKGHHPEYSQKVIEILQIDDKGEVRLGAPVFSDDPSLVRKIFSYTRSATMYLQYNPDSNRIDFDHLVPLRPEFEGDYKHYGPDLTHDGYRIGEQGLILEEDIDIHNPVRGDENRYIDPSRVDRRLKSGL